MQTLVFKKDALQDLFSVFCASLMISLSGYLSIPLWFTPVPLVTQNFMVLLAGAFLGPRRGALAVFFFLMQAMIGLPVLSGGTGGLVKFLGPTGGYLLGYLASSYFVGWWISERKKTMMNMGLALTGGVLLTYLLGASYLASFVGFKRALYLGILPFIATDALKLMVSLKLLKNWFQKGY